MMRVSATLWNVRVDVPGLELSRSSVYNELPTLTRPACLRCCSLNANLQATGTAWSKSGAERLGSVMVTMKRLDCGSTRIWFMLEKDIFCSYPV